MGADFLCAVLPIPKMKDGKPIELDYDGAFKAIEATDWMATEWGQNYYDDNDQCRAVLREAVGKVRDVVAGSFSREAGWIDRPTELLLVTGGMSWGDSPTNLFDKLVDLENAGIDVILTGGARVEDNTIVLRLPEAL